MAMKTLSDADFNFDHTGSLSAWFRLKYPHLVDGAVATSGPLLAQLDFSGKGFESATPAL